MINPDYTTFYNLDNYLFNQVHQNFTQNKSINTFDFFSIVIWKANRIKSVIYKGLTKKESDIDFVVNEITSNLYTIESNELKLKYLLKDNPFYKFRLPMATAILSVFYPNEFTVFDYRVCEIIKLNYNDIYTKTKWNEIWTEYLKYKESVIATVPHKTTLREKDMFLWGQSFYNDLKELRNIKKP